MHRMKPRAATGLGRLATSVVRARSRYRSRPRITPFENENDNENAHDASSDDAAAPDSFLFLFLFLFLFSVVVRQQQTVLGQNASSLNDAMNLASFSPWWCECTPV